MAPYSTPYCTVPYSTVQWQCGSDMDSGFLLLCTILHYIPGHVYRIAHMAELARPSPRAIRTDEDASGMRKKTGVHHVNVAA